MAFPLISAGVYGVPTEVALNTAVRAIRAFLSEHDDEMTVTLVLFGKKSLEAAEPYADEIRSYIDERCAEARPEAGDGAQLRRKRRQRRLPAGN